MQHTLGQRTRTSCTAAQEGAQSAVFLSAAALAELRCEQCDAESHTTHNHRTTATDEEGCEADAAEKKA